MNRGLLPFAPGAWFVEVALEEYAVRGAALVGTTHALAWDTLSHPRDMASVAPLVAGRDLVIVYSHADWDHVWGTAGLPYAGAAIVGHEECRRRFGADVPATLAAKQAAEPGAWDDVVLVPPTITLGQAWSVALGGLTLDVEHLPGHTVDCLVGFVPELGLLLAGDTVETPLPVVPPDADVAAWIAALRRWERDGRVRTVAPAHGPVGGADILRRNIGYLAGILEGRPLDPGDLPDPFYRRTHAENCRWRPARP